MRMNLQRAPQIKAKYFFVAGVAAFWQISFHDPAIISMEGILMLNKHLSMLIIVIVLLVGWFLLSVVSYFIGCCGIKIAPNPKGDDTGKSCQPRVDTRKLGPHKPVAKILPSQDLDLLVFNAGLRIKGDPALKIRVFKSCAEHFQGAYDAGQPVP